jgi:hypothetical protein
MQPQPFIPKLTSILILSSFWFWLQDRKWNYFHISIFIKYLTDEEQISVFTHILSVFSNICDLKLYSPSDFCVQRLSFEDHRPTSFSSTLMEFHVRVLSFSDCLYLLDGRFNQLHTLIVTIGWILPPPSMINNKVSYFMIIR